jgi:hypothetical protein
MLVSAASLNNPAISRSPVEAQLALEAVCADTEVDTHSASSLATHQRHKHRKGKRQP